MRRWQRFATTVAAATMAAAILSPAGWASAGARAPAADDPPNLPPAYTAFLASVGGSQYVQVDGVTIHYAEAGPKNRPTLLLLHGSPDNIYSWRAIMPALARHYHVIAPDLAGFGLSGHPAQPLTWTSEIHYLSGFIAAEHLRNLTLVATDIGGLFGFAYAAHHPGNVAAIAMWETVTAPIASYTLLGSYCAACVQFFQIPKDPALATRDIIDNPAFAQQIYGGPGLVHPLSGAALAGYSYFLATPGQRRLVAEIGANMPIGGRPAANFHIITQFARYLRTSTVPKLVLYATPGSIMPGSTAIGLGMPDTTYAAVGAGYHYLAEDEPAAITQAILKWRGRLSGARP